VTISDQTSTDSIELRVDEIPQLFHTLDPFPFREKDLDKYAEDYIVGWARELPPDQLIRITVHVPASEAETQRAKDLGEAIRRYFDDRASALDRDIKELFRIGRRSLIVGAGVLIFCNISARIAANLLAGGNADRFVEEGFLILGWVANWRPMEIFLYDWWPLARHRALFRRLSVARVEIIPHAIGEHSKH
jgi:hypothetical protein